MADSKMYQNWGDAGFTTKPRPGKNKCPECQNPALAKPHNRADRPMSVTYSPDGTALFNCHHCHFSGGVDPGWLSKEEWEQREKEGNDYVLKRLNPKAQRKIKQITADRPKVDFADRIQNELLEKPDKLTQFYQQFEKRGISEEVVKRYGVYPSRQYSGKLKSDALFAAFPFYEEDHVRMIKYRRLAEKEFRAEKGGTSILYGIQQIDPKEVEEVGGLVICEGEMDVLSFAEAGIPAVSVPNGAADTKLEFMENSVEFINQFSVFYIATDTDEAGEEMATELARRLGKIRCRRVTFGGCKDANELLTSDPEMGALQLSACLTDATAYPVENINRPADYIEKLLDYNENGHPDCLPSGLSPDFDELIKFELGQFIVVTGWPNHGKSPFIEYLALNLAAKYDWKVGVFSPEHPDFSLFLKRTISQLVGKPFMNANKMSRDAILSSVEWLQERYFEIRPEEGNYTIEEFLEIAKILVQVFGIKVLVLDHWKKLIRPKGMSAHEFAQYVINKFVSFCKEYGVLGMVVAHPHKEPNSMRKSGSARPEITSPAQIGESSEFDNLPDVVIGVWRDKMEDPNDGRVIENGTVVRVMKCKNQWQGKLGTVRFGFDVNCERYYPYNQTHQKHGALVDLPGVEKPTENAADIYGGWDSSGSPF